MSVLVLLFLAAGVFLQVLAAIGVLRLPDAYSRIHTVGVGDTAGILLVLFAVALSQGLSVTSLKLSFVMVFYLLANPAAAHAMGRAALRSGLAPWTREARP